VTQDVTDNISKLGKFPTWLFVALGMIVAGLHAWYVYPWALDDSYISFRYAQNFANGHGIVYNYDERVEGYTTFLWVFLLGVTHKIGVPLEFAGRVYGILFTFATLLVVANAHRFTSSITRTESHVAALILGTTGWFTAWAVCMMEVPLVAMLAATAMLLYLRCTERAKGPIPWIVAGLVAALAGMARPELVLLFTVLFVDRAIAFFRAKDRTVFWYTLGFFALGLPYFIWRVWYYQSLLPNTFYAKVGYTVPQMVRGLRYMFDFFGAAVFIVAPAAIMLARQTELTGISRPLYHFGSLLVVIFVYVTAVGGDIMPAYRFIAPFAPMLALLCGIAIHRLVPNKRAGIVFVALIIGYNFLITKYSDEVAQKISLEHVAPAGIEVGKWMRENLDSDGILATNTAGTIPFYSGLYTIDMLGLNDRTIARTEVPDMGQGAAGHEKGAGSYVLDRDPDYIQFFSASGSIEPLFRGDKEIWEETRFHENYTLQAYYFYPDWPTHYLYVHNRRIPNIQASARGEFPRFEWMNQTWQTFQAVEWTENEGETFRPIEGYRLPGGLPRGWDYFTSSRDQHLDFPTGTKTSSTFVPEENQVLIFWVGGGFLPEVGVELMRGEEVLRSRRGNKEDSLRPVVLDLSPFAGETLHVRLNDQLQDQFGRLHAGAFFLASPVDD